MNVSVRRELVHVGCNGGGQTGSAKEVYVCIGVTTFVDGIIAIAVENPKQGRAL